MKNDRSIFEQLYTNILERLANPLIASFMISWLLWNYSIVLTIFSGDLTSDDKITKIKEAVNVSDIYLWPLLIALGYIAVHTLLTFAVDAVILYRETLEMILRNWIRGIRSMTEEDKKRFFEIHDAEIYDLNLKVTTLRNIVNDKDNELRAKDEEIGKLRGTVNSHQDEINKMKQTQTPEQTKEAPEQKKEGDKNLSLAKEQTEVLYVIGEAENLNSQLDAEEIMANLSAGIKSAYLAAGGNMNKRQVSMVQLNIILDVLLTQQLIKLVDVENNFVLTLRGRKIFQELSTVPRNHIFRL